ncbi:class I SAM-dependent methyltransferase [Streptomyces roseolus]|uniref:class I SAM-dependent methyltransferase n=1 Tax=Streptomyces roseolus TaxID=67358 RepID=UPI00365D9258
MLAFQDTVEEPSEEVPAGLATVPACGVRKGVVESFGVHRFPSPTARRNPAARSSIDYLQGTGMNTVREHLGPSQWDTWYRERRSVDRLVTDAEAIRFLRHVAPSAGASVLDVGCGIGSFSRQLFRWGYNVQGLDFSPVAIRIAERRGIREGLRYGVHDFDAGAIPTTLQPRSLDLIVCRNVLPFMDHHRFLADARRWLRPGGQVYVLVRVWPERGGEPHDRPWQRGFTEEQVQDLQNGWAEQERYWLGRHTALFLAGEHRGSEQCAGGRDADPPPAARP